MERAHGGLNFNPGEHPMHASDRERIEREAREIAQGYPEELPSRVDLEIAIAALVEREVSEERHRVATHNLDLLRIVIHDKDWWNQFTAFAADTPLGEAARMRELQVQAAIEREVERRLTEEREACALLHEQVNVSHGVDPMAAVIEYRDRIRGRSNG